MPNKEQLKIKITFRTKIILVIFGLFIFFILLETGLRLGGFIILSMQECRNAQALKQKDSYRILCLGESTTQSSYPQNLEDILNQQNIGVHFSVINEGHGGINTSTILYNLKSYIMQYHPNMVVAMMGVNDEAKYQPVASSSASKIMRSIGLFKTSKLFTLFWLHLSAKIKKAEDPKASCRITDFTDGQTGYMQVGPEKIPEMILTEEQIKQTVAQNPGSDKELLRLAKFYREVQSDFAQAEEQFKRVIALNPENSEAYSEAGFLYLDQARFPEAEEAFKKALALDPRNDNTYLGLGWLYQEIGEFPEAEDAFKKSIAINPPNDQNRFALGKFYLDQNEFLKAQDLFKQTLELNPLNARVYGAMAVLYSEMGNPVLAEKCAQKAKRLRFENYYSLTVDNYLKLKEILDNQGIRLVCVQYPLRNVEPLKNIFQGQTEGMIFVDNQAIFEQVIKESGYNEYFTDMFGGDFGHCTNKGYFLLARNIADVMLKEVFNK